MGVWVPSSAIRKTNFVADATGSIVDAFSLNARENNLVNERVKRTWRKEVPKVESIKKESGGKVLFFIFFLIVSFFFSKFDLLRKKATIKGSPPSNKFGKKAGTLALILEKKAGVRAFFYPLTWKKAAA